MRFLFALIVTIGVSCSSNPAIEDISASPSVTARDKQYADVYKMLDGTWEGVFKIYIDTRGQQIGESKPTVFDPDSWQHLPYKLSSQIDVTQVYTSESPYFQRVKITDRYPNGKVAESEGANKVQDGKLYCVVKKPDDLVIHDGSLEGPKTIVWQRHRESPTAVEFFRETVTDDTYRIVGWGYYGNDELSKSPRMFFDASYRRQ